MADHDPIQFERYAAFQFQVITDFSSKSTEAADVIHMRAKGRQIIGQVYRPAGTATWYADARAGLLDAKDVRVSDLETRDVAVDAVIGMYIQKALDGEMIESGEEEVVAERHQQAGVPVAPATSRMRTGRPAMSSYYRWHSILWYLLYFLAIVAALYTADMLVGLLQMVSLHLASQPPI